MSPSTAPSSPLTAFVPRSLRAALADGRRDVPFEDVSPSAVILADIAGFTPLADALAREGGRGAEALTTLLNDVLGALVDRIEADGGDILKFAGDAILARWSDAPIAESARRATACAHALHAVAARASAAHGLSLGLSVGVGAGTVRLLVVGRGASRWESLPLGPAITQVASAAKDARHGETILSEESFALLADIAAGSTRPSGNVLLRSPPPATPVPTATHPGPVPAEVLGRFVAIAVRERLDAQVEWASELRRVTAIFVHLSAHESEPLDRVDDAFGLLCRVIDDTGGTVDKLTVDEKGVTAVAALGLPPGAHGDDPVRAVRASLELQDALTSRGWTTRIGVATGRVFCGVVGSPKRREYTVIGDTVNVAARLMQRAEGHVLCHESTVQACRHSLAFGETRQLHLDGKVDEIRAAVPFTGGRPAEEESDPVRAAELDALYAGLDALAAGRGGFWLIEGVAGQGKSRLLSRVLAEARQRGIEVLAGSADSSDRGAPYRAWRGVVTTLLGLDSALDPTLRTRRLLERLEGDSYATARCPLLAELLGVNLPDNPLTASFSGEVRAFNTQDLLVHLLRSASTAGRALVVAIDDVHWLDSASLGLLREAKRQLPGVLLLLSGRPTGDGGTPVLPGLEPTRRLVLGSLDLAGTTLLLGRVLGTTPDPQLAETVHERAEGHPFFTVELARSLVESGDIVLTPAPARLRTLAGGVPMPETVQGAILSRLDRLDPVAQLVAKVASVIGRSYPWGILQAVHPVEGHRPELRRRCDELVAADVSEPLAEGPEPTWRYVHETTREVAYELLLFAQRRQLHEAVATALEHAAAARPPNASLAYHWERAERLDRALPYLEAFADDALREGAYVEAERAFARLLESSGGPGAAVSDDRRAHWELQHGEALLGLGHLEASRAALERAVSLLGFGVPRGPVALAGALTAGLAQQVVRRTLKLRPRTLAPEVADRHRKAARASLRIIETCFFLAGPVETTHAALRALQIAEAAGPSPELARAYALFGWILSMVPLFSAADHYLALASALVERPDCAAAGQPVRFFTGFTRTATGRWEESRAALSEAIELAHAQGDKRRWIESVCGICSPLHYQGEYEARVELGKGVLYASARRQGDRQAEAWGILDQLESLMPIGDLDRIAPLLGELEPYLGRPIGRSEQVWANGLLALGRFLQGRMDEAQRAAVATTDAAAAMDPVAVYVYEGHASAVEVLLQLTRAGADLGRELDRAYRELSRYARVFPYARARALSCEARILALRGKRRASAAARKAVAAAIAIRMPLEEAIARWTLGTLTSDASELTAARALLTRLGAQAWVRLLGA